MDPWTHGRRVRNLTGKALATADAAGDTLKGARAPLLPLEDEESAFATPHARVTSSMDPDAAPPQQPPPPRPEPRCKPKKCS